MRPQGLRSLAALAVVTLFMGGTSVAHACTNREAEVVRLKDGISLVSLPMNACTLGWRNSVTLTKVYADYIFDEEGQIIQVAERFSAHGPGMAYAGAGWRVENDQMVIDLDRHIPRLIFRSAPAHENHLVAGEIELDLTQWPATPLEIRALDCKEPQR